LEHTCEEIGGRAIQRSFNEDPNANVEVAQSSAAPVDAVDIVLQNLALSSLSRAEKPIKAEYDSVAHICWSHFASEYAVITLLSDQCRRCRAQYVATSAGNDQNLPFIDFLGWLASTDNQVFSVPDMWTIEVLKNHPLVSRDPRLRSYLGIRLRNARDETVGALSVFGTMRARNFSQEDVELLKEFAKMLEHIINRHIEQKKEMDECKRVRILNDYLISGINHCSEGFVLLRNNPETSINEVVYANEGWVLLSGFPVKYSIGKDFSTLLKVWGATGSSAEDTNTFMTQLSSASVAQFDLSISQRTTQIHAEEAAEPADLPKKWVRFHSSALKLNENKQLESMKSDVEALKSDPAALKSIVEELKCGEAMEQCFQCQDGNIMGTWESALKPPAHEEMTTIDGGEREVPSMGRISGSLNRLVFVHITEVTDQIEALTQLEEAYTELESATSHINEADKAKSNFIAITSQETRNPLNAILGCSELLNANPNLPDEQSQLAKNIHRASCQLLGLISGVLDINQSETQSFQLNYESFHLLECIDMCMDLQSHHAKMKDKQLTSYCDPQVPLIVYGDETRLRQVLTNLLTNACKFTLKGEVSLSVKVIDKAPEIEPEAIVPEPCFLMVPEMHGDNKGEGNEPVILLFEVTDTGIGIPEGAEQWLFKLFSQGDSSRTRQFEGSGIGLVISQHLVEHMGGQIYVTRNKEGPGCTFHFYIVLHTNAEDNRRRANTRSISPKLKVLSISTSRLWHLGSESTMRLLGFQETKVIQTNEELADLMDKFRHQNSKRAQNKRYRKENPPEDERYYVVLVDEDRVPVNSLAEGRYFQQVLEDTSVVLLVSIFSSFSHHSGAHGKVHYLTPPMTNNMMSGLVSNLMQEIETNLPDLHRSFHTGAQMDSDMTNSRESVGFKKMEMDLRILVVDDTDSNCMVMRMLLGHMGLTDVEFAYDGKQALEMVQEAEYNLVFMDLHMPIMDGLTSFRNMRQIMGDKTPMVVAVTADVVEGVMEDCLDAGMMSYLSKPVSMQKVHEFLTSSGMLHKHKEELVISPRPVSRRGSAGTNELSAIPPALTAISTARERWSLDELPANFQVTRRGSAGSATGSVVSSTKTYPPSQPLSQILSHGTAGQRLKTR